jgi:glutathione S-transferase
VTRIILHDYFRSSASYRVRIALNLKGVTYEQRAVSLVDNVQQSPGYKARNPQGFVPMLEIGEERVTQSLAILDRLDTLVEEPPFVPADPAGRTHVLALRYVKGELGAPQEAVDAWYRHWVAEGLAALEALAAPKAGAFLHGDTVSMADICLVPQLYNGRRFDVAMEVYPTLLRAEASALALPAFAAAHPDRQETKA